MLSEVSRGQTGWGQLISTMRGVGCVAPAFPIFCPRHPGSTALHISKPDDTDNPHCAVPCPRTLSCGHRCALTCHADSPTCLDRAACKVKVQYKFPDCAHDVAIVCSTPLPSLCRVPCPRKLACGHACHLMCGQECPSTSSECSACATLEEAARIALLRREKADLDQARAELAEQAAGLEAIMLAAAPSSQLFTPLNPDDRSVRP
jgi:hypothetical protein